MINQAILKKSFILFFVLLIGGAGIYYYFTEVHHKKIDSWLLVPSNAIIAYENSSLIDNWNRIIDRKVWKTMKKMPFFEQWESGLSEADSLTGKDGTLDKLFRNRRFIISIHIISSSKFDFLFNLDLKDQSGKSNFERIIRGIEQDFDVIAKSRNYLGYELHELQRKSDKSTFTYFVYENVVVGSYTPFLVEDVVRAVADGMEESFKSQITALSNISRLENDEGNIYIDYAKLPDLIATLLTKQPGDDIKQLAQFSGDTYLDVKITEAEILLNGVTTVDLSSKKSFIGTFRNQNPGRISVTDIMPNSTAALFHLYVSDFKEWHNQLTKHWSATNPEQLDHYLDFESKYQLSLDWLSGEAASAILETPNKEEPDQLAFIGINDKDVVFAELSAFAEKLGAELGDSVYLEKYNDMPIMQLPYKDFPSILMGSYFNGYENSFITIYKDYLVIGNSMQVVKSFYNDVESDDIWGKSVRQSIFLENTLSEASFSMMINTSLCWQTIINNLDEQWAEIFKAYEGPIKSFDLISLQISNLDQRFYTSIAMGHKERKEVKRTRSRLQKKQSVFAISPIITKPYIVRNHNNNNFEILVQDSSNILYLVSKEGEILWGDSLKQPISTSIHQIDFYKNKKLQYLFATKDQLHLLDRNGDYVENYPINLNGGVEVQFLSVIDYDNSKRYRFMIVDKSGDLYLYDKNGKNLEGWTPRTLDESLAIPGFHIRVRGGDCMITIQENGILNVMNRRGQMYPGFPLDLKIPKVSDVFLSIGNDFSSTKLTTISEEGELIEVNLQGQIVKREQLYKPTKESRFWLVKDALNKTFVIARQEYNKISFLNNKGETIFERSLLSSGELTTQYYNFNADHQVFVVLDREQEFVYLFNRSGETYSFEPFECRFPVGILYSEKSGEFHLYKCYNNNLTLETFK